GLDARKACIEERSVVGNYVSTAEVRLTTQTVPDRRPNATVGGGFRKISSRPELALDSAAWIPYNPPSCNEPDCVTSPSLPTSTTGRPPWWTAS
ncbi:MAG: hypothetical protein GX934_14875, partial [Burkholderiales bacterium]|nr:hypothetical protein [Burkholderiales bacterium]